MITSNVINRVFMLRYQGGTATIFSIEVEGREYLVTAKHAVTSLSSDTHIEIYHHQQWRSYPVNLVGHSQGDMDVAVLAAQQQVAPRLALPPTSGGLIYGQDVFFLGFPYGWINQDIPGGQRPLPFVKKAIVSLMEKTGTIFYLDGHNNRGFSGGPVVFKPHNSNDFHVAGVISGYLTMPEAGTHGKVNTGIIKAFSIRVAREVIAANPIGHPLG